MTKNRKKMIAKVVAGGMLIVNIPTQTFANEIEDAIENTEEILNNKETNSSDIENETEVSDLNELENKNIINNEIDLNNPQSLDEILKIENSNILEIEDGKSSLITKEVESNKYIINTIDDLKQLREDINVNSLDTTGMIVELGTDIDFTGEASWESIGTIDNKFKGTFDGKNYTIKNINIVGDFKGLFDYTDNPTFKNITFDNINIISESTGQVGLVVGISNNGIKLNNLAFTNISLDVKNASYVGGIIGNMNTGLSSISNVSFEGYIKANKTYSVGGLMGMGFGNIENVKMQGEIISDGSNIGGVIGLGLQGGIDKSSSKIQSIESKMNIKGINEDYGGYMGGIVGQVLSAISFENILVESEYIISENKNMSSGGIAGFISDSANIVQKDFILDCIIQVEQIVGSKAGGITGYVNSGAELEIQNNKVYSNIEGYSYTGGIVGEGGSTVFIKNNLVKNEYVKGKLYVGGVLGYSYKKVDIENNSIESKVTSSGNSAGIIGTLMYSNSSTVMENSFKGIIESTSANGMANGISTEWTASDSTISKNSVEAEIVSQGDKSSGLIGNLSSTNCNMENNTIRGSIYGKDLVGGLIGNGVNFNNNIRYNDIDVKIIANNKVGGLGGSIQGWNIENNKIKSNIIANDSVGGIVGETVYPDTLYSKNAVYTNIVAKNNIGGIMGSGNPVKINNNFIEGSLTGKSNIGGAIGYISMTSSNPAIESSVLAMTIKGESSANAIIGQSLNDISVKNVYYDTNLTELTDTYGGIGLTTSQMQGKESFKNMDLDFENIWNVNKEFYPYFEQINSAPDIIPNDKVVDLTMTINQYDEFNPLDYVTVEDFEGDKVTITIKETIDTSKYGTFIITYVATDSKGLFSELTLNLKINPLMIKVNETPIIIAEDIILTVGDEFNPLKVIAVFDKEDGILTSTTKVIENTVNTNKAGVYKVTYEVTDKDGAKATKTITVTVKEKVVSNNNQNNNQNNSTTTDDKKDANTTKKPQTSDIGFISLSGILMSTVGLCSINRKKEE